MKLKLNLNVDGVKRLLIQHGEKAVFGLAALVLLWFFWATLQLEVLKPEMRPDPLRTLAEQTKQHVVASAWDAKARKIEVLDYPARAEHVPLDDDSYHLRVYFDKPLWEQHGKRPTPKVWPVEELVAVSGRGMLAIKKEKDGGGDPDADAETRQLTGDRAPTEKGARVRSSADVAPQGFFYVVITGLVPLRKQTAEYTDAFQTSVVWNRAKDVPFYQDMKIERAEVNDADPNRLAWQEIDLAAVDRFTSKWPDAKINDVVDSQYIDAACTMPLGPLMGEDWSPAVADHPKIPPAERFDKSKKTDKTDQAAAPASGQRPGWTRGGTRETPEKTAAPAAGAKPVATSAKPDQMLFRFVDYFVEPGKKYCYRVKLKLDNPNLKMLERNLVDPEQARVRTLETDWSQPTPVVTVPRGYRILAGPLSPARNNSPHDPEVEVCVVGFDQKRGGEPAEKKAVQRGTLLNFMVDNIWVIKPDHSALVNWNKVDLRSNALVIDVQGGRKLTKTLVEPIEILVLDGDGHAMVHSELDDADEYHARLDPLSEKGAKPDATPVSNNPYEETKPKPPRGKSGKGAKAAAAKAAKSATSK